MSVTNKVMLALFFAAVVVVAIIYAKILTELGRRADTIARLEMALSECGHRVNDADAAIKRQNDAVDAVKVDTVIVERLIKEAERKYVETREVVIQSLERDSSCENKIDAVDYTLRRFHGVTLRPESGDKDRIP